MAPLVADPAAYQWDLRVYLAAGRASATGLDPTRLDSLEAVGGGELGLPYLYPPAMTWIFRLLAMLPEPLCWWLWLGAKLVALAWLWRVWRRWVVPEVDPLLLAFVLLAGFGGALLVDLQSGNLSLFEQALLWSGLAAWLHRRPALAALLIGLAAAPKLLPLALAALLLADRRCWPAAVGAAALLGLLLLVPDPSQQRSYFEAARTSKQLWETGHNNPCAFAVLVELGRAGRLDVIAPGPRGVFAVWAVYALGILGLAWRPCRAALAGGDRLALLFNTTLAYALVAPRMKDYTYVLIVPAAVWIITRLPRRALPVLAALVVAGLGGASTSALPDGAIRFVREYHAWLAALALFGCAVASPAIRPSASGSDPALPG